MPAQIQGKPFTPPAHYCEGLARALLGEQNAVQKYRRILYSDLYAKNGCRGSQT